MSEPIAKRRQVIRWTAYTLIMATALWTHFLSGLVIAIFGFAWLLVKDADRPRNRSFMISGFISNTMILVLFSPWVRLLAYNFYHMNNVQGRWMTPTTIPYLIHSYLENITLGRWMFGYYMEHPYAVVISRVVLGIILIIILITLFSLRKNKLRSVRFSFTIWFALLVYLIYPFLLYFLTAWDFAYIFHAPRYGQLVMPISLIGIGGLLFNAPLNKYYFNAFGCVALVGVFFFSHYIILTRAEKTGFLEDKVRQPETADALPPKGSEVYIYPDYMAHYHTSLEPYFAVRTFSDLKPDDFDGEKDLNLFYISSWYIHGTETKFIYGFMKTLPFKTPRESHDVIQPQLFEIYRIENATSQEVETLINFESPTPWPEFPADAARVFLPQKLKQIDGWNELEFDAHMNSFSWGKSERMDIRVEPPLPEGDYTYRLIGFRHPMDGNEAELSITFGNEVITKSMKEGSFQLKVPFTVPAGETLSFITIEHPKFQPSQYDENSGDDRWLTFIYSGSYVME